MRNQQDDQHIWYYIGIAGIVLNRWILPQQLPTVYILAIGCISIGLIGGLEPIYKTLSDLGQRILQRLPVVERKLLLIGVGAAIPVVRWLQTKLAEVRADIERRDQIDNLIDDFVDAATAIGMYVPDVTSDDRDSIQTAVLEDQPDPINKPVVYQAVAQHLYAEESPTQIETRLVLLYTYEIDETNENSQKSKFQREIDKLLTSVSFHPLDDDGRQLLSVFIYLRNQGWQESTCGAVFEQDADITKADIERFVKQYTRQQFSTYFLRSKEQAEEFRQTLADLVRHGRVQLQNLTEDIIQEKLDDAKQQLEEREDRYSSYIVMSTKLLNANDDFGAVEALEDKFPQSIYIPNKQVAGNGFPDLQFVSMRLVYTDQAYESAEDFIEQELKPLLPAEDSEEWPDGGFVAAIPFEAPDAKFYPPADVVLAAEDSAKRDARRDNIDAVKMMTVAREAAAANIVADDVQREEEIDTLLRVIPFNVVAPKLDAKVKNFIKYNYGEIKPHFPEVDSLFHWPEVDEAELAAVLRELDVGADGTRVCEDWDRVVATIMEEIKGLAEASHISVYSESTMQISPV